MRIPLRRYYTLLVSYLRPQWARVLLLGVFLFAGIGLQLLNPQILRYFIDTARAGGATPTLVRAALLFAGVALVRNALVVAATYTGENVGWTATNGLRSDLAEHCLSLDMSFHKAHTPGELIERIDGDVTALATFFSQFAIQVLGNVVLLAGVLFVVWRIDWRAGLAMLVFSAASLAVMVAIRNLAVPYWAAARQASADWSGFLVERLAGTEDIRALGGTDYTMRRAYELQRVRLHRERRAGLMSSAMGLSTIGTLTGGTALALALGGLLYRANLVSLGTAYMIFYYVEMLFRPLMTISRQLEDLQKASAGIERIEAIMHMQSRTSDGTKGLPAGPLEIEFEHVSFGYDGEASVLHDLSFRLRPGRVLGLLGRTGSGKTTITRLLLRLYDPNSGTVWLAGTDMRQVRLEDLRRRVGVVTQDVQLFQASVRENLTFFDPAISDERILQVLGELGLMDWYKSLPAGLDTELAADGCGLSAGQAQLLALARVFLREPGLVILDEASSRLDSATEQMIERAIDRLLENRTGVVVAHRLATVQRADEIMILEDGRICEHGGRELLARDPGSRFAGLLRTGLEEALA